MITLNQLCLQLCAKITTMKKFLVFSVFFAAFLLPAVASAAAFYVDNAVSTSGDGTSWARAWKSFTNINWNSIQPGDTVYISGGSTGKTYTEKLVIRHDGTSESDRIYIRTGQETGHNGSVTLANGIQIGASSGGRADFVAIDGRMNGRINMFLTTSGDGATISHWYNGAKGNKYLYLDITTSQATRDEQANCIDLSAHAQDIEIAYNQIHNCFGRGIREGGNDIIYFGRIKIHHNNFRENRNDPIGIGGGVDVYNNNFNGIVASYGTIHMDGIQGVDGYWRIYNNVFHDHTQEIFIETTIDSLNSEEGAYDIENIFIFNNIFYDADSRATSPGVFLKTKTPGGSDTWSNIVISNNVFEGVLMSAIWFQDSDGSGITMVNSAIANNIFMNNAANIDFTNGPVRWGTGQFRWSNNIFYNPTTIGESNSDARDNLFTPATFINQAGRDYRLTANSAGVNTGINLSSYCSTAPDLCRDKDGVARPQGSGWDIGAYEYGSTSASPPTGGGGGNIYYVATTGSDTNPGTSEQPFRTIGRCASAAQAGDTCLVQAGTYNERVSTFRSGTASNRIVIKGESAAKPTVSGFSINNAYITVEGFRISNTGTAVTVSGANYCEILNNEFLGAEEGIDMSGSPTGCRIRGNWFHGSTVVSVLITLRGSGHVVENNEFGPLVMHEDIFRPFGDNNTIRNNYFRNITSGATGGHMDIFQIYGGASDRRVTNLLFEQNFVNGWPGQAWMVDCTPDSRLITVRNNVFYNVNSAGQSYCPENLIYSNTFARSGFGNGRAVMIRNGADEGAPSRGLGTNSKIKNNIFYYTSYSGDAYAGGYDVDNGAQSTFEGRNNIAFPTTASGLTPGTNNINGTDPQFANASNAVGADGRPFTADDGLIPPTNSPVCGAGEAGTDIGAYKCGGAGLPAAGPPTGGGGSNQSPTVSITSPTNGQNFATAPASITLTANVSDTDGSIAKVEFYMDNMLRGTDGDNRAPWSYTFGSVTAGSHTYKVTAYDDKGATASASVSVTVGAGSPAPASLSCARIFDTAAAPCPTLSVSKNTITSTEPITITLTPQSRQYIYKTIFISNPLTKTWVDRTLTTCGSDNWCTSSESSSHSLILNALNASEIATSFGGAGTHYVASWDWTWNGSCWLGPEGACPANLSASKTGTGKWRVQKFEVRGANL